MGFQDLPRLTRGALVTIDLLDPTPHAIVFQYNPDTLSRSLQVQGASHGGDRTEALRITTLPVETFKLEVEFDATDALAAGDPLATASGILPQLDALEALLHPPAASIVAATALLAAGTLEIAPAMSPLTLFVYGPQRVLPVRLTEYSVTEEAHDATLNPIRAKVSLGLQVLSSDDLPADHPGYHLYLSNRVASEGLARGGVVSGAGSLVPIGTVG